MTNAQTIALDFDEEMKNTRKLLERVPLDGQLRSYKPHEKSMPLDRLASHVAQLPSWPKYALETEIFTLPADAKMDVAASGAELVEMFDRSVAEGRAAIDKAIDSEMDKTWTFRFGDQTVFSAPRPHVLRSFLNHLIHHRAQLGVYLRLNGIPIPGMYGPSADEQ